MAIVKYRNQSGTLYAYEAYSRWDPEKKQARSVRKYLGRVDEETGEIIATTGKRGRPRKNPVEENQAKTEASEYQKLYEEEAALRRDAEWRLKKLQLDYDALQRKYREVLDLLEEIHRQSGKYPR